MHRLGVVLVVVLAGCAGLAPAGSGPVVSSTVSPTSTPTPTDGVAATAGATTTTAAGVQATVVDVVDGDTVDIRYGNGSSDTVRLLGIDTPEVHVENQPAEYEGVPETEAGTACLRDAGESAGAAVRERIAGEQVRVVVDATADRRDPYGRLLAYVVHEGTDLNRLLVARGHARVYDSTFARSSAYYDAEDGAQDAGRGLWQCRDPA
jgi:micrococcal nuclease